MMKRVWIALLACLLLAAVAACGTSASTSGSGAPSQEPQPEYTETAVQQEVPSAIPWQDAANYEGESVTIEGPVLGAMYAAASNGEPTFLNVGKDYPDPGRFTIVIWGENRGAFSEAPEDAYADKTVRVTGAVDSYEGVPQIEISSPDDIEIVE
jgi:DNA/RNA endonuclease YhcR with UshA esterase domain